MYKNTDGTDDQIDCLLLNAEYCASGINLENTTDIIIGHKMSEEKIHQIYSHIQVGGAKYGTQTMNQCLYDLIQSKTVLAEDALSRSPNYEELERMLRTDVG